MCIVYLWFATLAGRWCLDIQGAHSQSLKRSDCELEVHGNVALHATTICGKGIPSFPLILTNLLGYTILHHYSCYID